MTPTSTVMIFSKIAYDPNHTSASPTSPQGIPQAGIEPPNIAASGSADDVIAVAP